MLGHRHGHRIEHMSALLRRLLLALVRNPRLGEVSAHVRLHRDGHACAMNVLCLEVRRAEKGEDAARCHLHKERLVLATAHQLVSTLRAGRRGHAALGAACATLATPLQTAALGVGDARGFCLCLRLCQTHEHGVGPNGREDSEGRSVLRLAIEVLETAPLELTPHALQRACRDELFRIRIHDPAHEDDCMRACIHRAVTRILSLFGGEGLQHALIPAPCAVEDHLEPPPDGARARLQARLGLCRGIGRWTVVRCEVARRGRALLLARR